MSAILFRPQSGNHWWITVNHWTQWIINWTKSSYVTNDCVDTFEQTLGCWYFVRSQHILNYVIRWKTTFRIPKLQIDFIVNIDLIVNIDFIVNLSDFVVSTVCWWLNAVQGPGHLQAFWWQSLGLIYTGPALQQLTGDIIWCCGALSTLV